MNNNDLRVENPVDKSHKKGDIRPTVCLYDSLN